MRKFQFAVVFAIIVFIMGCNSGPKSKNSTESRVSVKSEEKELLLPKNNKLKTNENSSIDVNNESAKLNELLKTKVGDVAKAKALPLYAKDSLLAICAICNNKIDQNARRKYDKSTNQKSISLKNENTTVNEVITLYYQNNQLIQLSKRLIGGNNNVLKLDVFNFDENIDCFSRYQWTLENKYSFYDVIYNGLVIRYDMNNKYFALSSIQKQELIQSAQSSLESLMRHFPEFKYSINWK